MFIDSWDYPFNHNANILNNSNTSNSSSKDKQKYNKIKSKRNKCYCKEDKNEEKLALDLTRNVKS